MILKLSSFREPFWIWARTQLILNKTYKMTLASWEDSVQTMQSGVVWSVSSLKKQWVLGSHTVADRDSGNTAQSCRLIWDFADIVYVCVGQQPADRAPQPAPHSPLPATPHLVTFTHLLQLSFGIFFRSEVALIYNDRAVLENHHISAAFRLMQGEEHNILANLSKEEYRYCILF